MVTLLIDKMSIFSPKHKSNQIKNNINLGDPAIIALKKDLRPVVLRLRFSPDLPLSIMLFIIFNLLPIVVFDNEIILIFDLI